MFSDKVVRRRLLRAAVILLVLVSADNAKASYPPIELKLNGGTADFGSSSHSLGSPVGNGRITFEFRVLNGRLTTTAKISGQLYWDSLEAGCARLTIEFRRDNRQTENRVVDRCGPGGNANLSGNRAAVDEEFSDTNLRAIIIKTQEVINSRVITRETSPVFNVPIFRSDHIKIENGREDFGEGNHSFGSPTSGARVTLSNDNGVVTGSVSGKLYWDDLFKDGCAHMFIEYQTSGGSTLKREPFEKCGPGGNANEPPNQLAFIHRFTSGELFKIRIGVGGYVKSVTFSFEP